MSYCRASRSYISPIIFLMALLFSGLAHALTPLPSGSTEISASEAIAIQDPESKAAVRDLVSQLNDDAVRTLLIERLDAVAEAKELAASNQVGSASVLQQGFSAYWNNAKTSVGRSAEIPSIIDRIFSSIREASAPDGLAHHL